MTGSKHLKEPSPKQGEHHIVSFTERDISDAKRLLTIIVGGNPETSPVDPAERRIASAPAAAPGDPDRENDLARQIFVEPAWEMLLVLYLEEAGERQTQTRLGDLSGATRSTAMRWIDHLLRKGLVRREGHPTDKRRNFIILSDKGRELLELYLSETCC